MDLWDKFPHLDPLEIDWKAVFGTRSLGQTLGLDFLERFLTGKLPRIESPKDQVGVNRKRKLPAHTPS